VAEPITFERWWTGRAGRLDANPALAHLAADPAERTRAVAAVEASMREPFDRLPKALAKRGLTMGEVQRVSSKAGLDATKAAVKAMDKLASSRDRHGVAHLMRTVFGGVEPPAVSAQQAGASDNRTGSRPQGRGPSGHEL